MIKEHDCSAPHILRQTQVDNVLISTVGYPHMRYTAELIQLLKGDGWEYETMVFSCSDDGVVTNWGELYAANYSTEEAARRGHESTIKRYTP